jgi:serine protease DegQ
MKRRFGIAAATAIAGLLLTPQIAWPGIPVSAVSDSQGVPTLAPVIKRVAASVVSITVRAPRVTAPGFPDPMDDPLLRGLLGAPVAPQYQTFAAGSGVVIDSAKGLIVTNYHVIQDADEITITLLDGRQAKGVLAGADPDTDVALIKINLPNLTAIPGGDSDRLQVGDFVLAIGNPFGIGQTVTSGIVSGLKRNHMGLEGYEDFIQTDASINPGNSGGALVNLRGELVGINAAIVDNRKGGNAGIGFAIPVNMVRAISSQLEKYGAVERGELGFALSPLTADLVKEWKLPADASGVLITKVDAHSAAERAGLKTGDVVTAIGGTPVQDVPDLRNRLAILRVGDSVELTVLRAGRSMQVRAVIDEPSWNALDGNLVSDLLDGALFINTPTGGIAKGVQVTTVRGGSNAWASGLREGDIITTVNKRRVIGLDQFATEAGKLSGGMALDVIRDGEKLSLTIRMTESKRKT